VESVHRALHPQAWQLVEPSSEIAISLFSRQCLGKRGIGDRASLRKETRAWNRRSHDPVELSSQTSSQEVWLQKYTVTVPRVDSNNNYLTQDMNAPSSPCFNNDRRRSTQVDQPEPGTAGKRVTTPPYFCFQSSIFCRCRCQTLKIYHIVIYHILPTSCWHRLCDFAKNWNDHTCSHLLPT
jgi:hypothetical protein